VIRLGASGSAASGLPFELGGNLIYFFSGLFFRQDRRGNSALYGQRFGGH
jgi:hypothetical protein